MSDDDTEALRAKADALLAELATIRAQVDEAEEAKERRLQIWLQLRDVTTKSGKKVRITNSEMAEASGLSHVAVGLALKRHDELAATAAEKERSNG